VIEKGVSCSIDKAAASGAIIYAGREPYKLDDATWAIPWNFL